VPFYKTVRSIFNHLYLHNDGRLVHLQYPDLTCRSHSIWLSIHLSTSDFYTCMNARNAFESGGGMSNKYLKHKNLELNKKIHVK